MSKVRRAIGLKGMDTTLEISKIVSIKVSAKEFIYLDKLPNDTWRIVYTASTIPDIQKLDSINIIREG